MHLRRPAALFAILVASTLVAADWPQWRGPERTGKSAETGLLKAWPKEGPKLAWSTDTLGAGYAAPAVVGDAIFILGSDDDNEYLFRLDAATGKTAWKAKLGPLFKNDWGGGPRGTPTVANGQVFALGAKGDLVCVDAKSGKEAWKTNLVEDLGGAVPFWGYSESPLVDEGKVVVTPGGKRGCIAALDAKTGKAVWRSKDLTDTADYASVVIGNARGKKQYVQMAGQSVAGVDAKTGDLLWRFERKHRITIPTPIVFDNFVYVTSSYGVGCNLLEITPDGKVKEVYASKLMSNHHGGVVLLDGKIYGHSDTRGWVCQDAKKGEEVWTSGRKFPKGSLAYADGMFYLYAETDGTVALVEATPKEYTEVSRFTIPKTTSLPKPLKRGRDNVWAHPVVSNGKLYLREQELLFCYDVKAK